MSYSKSLGIVILVLIALVVWLNWPSKKGPQEEVALTIEEPMVAEEFEEIVEEIPVHAPEPVVSQTPSTLKPISDDSSLPADVDRMCQLFQPYPPLLPIVETVTFSSRVAWLTGRAAYLGDYASHYQTSKHFISRSLHGVGNYFSDVVSKGDRFNVFKEDKEIEFHLVLDLARLKIWVYYYDKDEDAKMLLKTYPVCAGKLNPQRRSGSLTPLGTFALGNEIAVYKEGTMGTFKNETRELVNVFGVRWIPFGREIGNCTGSSKGLGLHGVPWKRRAEGEELVECRECIGNYESGGCVRLLTEDIEELFAVIVSKPSFIHIVRDFSEAHVPGRDIVF